MATRLINNSGNYLTLQPYGGTVVPPGAAVILTDQLATVVSALGPTLVKVCRLDSVPDGQLGAIQPIPAPGASFAVPYTATGSEGTDITLAIGVTMPTATYGMTWTIRGNSGGNPVVSAEPIDLPLASRTQTTFRVVFGAQPAAGDQFEFRIYP